jgi:hypothetical protein
LVFDKFLLIFTKFLFGFLFIHYFASSNIFLTNSFLA